MAEHHSNTAVKNRSSFKTYLPWILLGLGLLAAMIAVIVLVAGPSREKVPDNDPTTGEDALPAPSPTPEVFVLPDGAVPLTTASALRQTRHRDGFPMLRWDPDKFLTAENGRIYYADSSVKTLTGVDVSEHQYDIDWAQVAGADIDFAMIRMGYRGSTAGGLYEDPYFRQNIEGALENGIGVGIYFYSQAVSPEEALAEADFLLDALDGYEIEFPVVFDWEIVGGSEARTYTASRRTLNQCAILFCDRIEAAGYDPMIYFTQYLGYRKYDLRRLSNYGFWYAEYEPTPGFLFDFDMWQYTATAGVPGIEGDVDMNLYFPRD